VDVRAWPLRFRRALEGWNYKDEASKWDAAVADVVVPRDAATLPLIIELLEKQLDRALQSVKNIDDKATLIVPGIGVIAGITGTNVRRDIGQQPELIALGALAGLGAVLAVLLAVVAVYPRSYDNGPNALLVVQGSDVTVEEAGLGYVKALGFAVRAAEALNQQKAAYLNWALRVAGIAIVFLTAFVGLGGFRAGGSGGG
jgi:hypothetical protein